jgi:hypothetical protein
MGVNLIPEEYKKVDYEKMKERASERVLKILKMMEEATEKAKISTLKFGS